MKNRRRIKRIRVLLLAGIIICLIRIGQAYYDSLRYEVQQDELREMVEMSRKQSGEINTDITVLSEEPEDIHIIPPEEENVLTDGISLQTEEDMPAILNKYAALYEKNQDFAGWLFIEGTEIDYPVMQRRDGTKSPDEVQHESGMKDEDEYYLHHDFYGEDSRYGCLYIKEKADIDRGTNIIIYGHNMRDGSMFGTLDLYEAEGFYRKHSVISFDTLYEERTYEIIAVFPAQVSYTEEDVFKYYQFYQADTKEEFEEFYKNIKELSLYDTGVGAEYGDTFLTLSTCAYHAEDGRFVVIAKRI